MILRTKFWLLGLLLLLLGQQWVKADDYGEDGASAGENSNSGDIYDPAQLEQEVEEEAQHHSSLEDEGSAMPPQTDNSLSMEQLALTTARPAPTEPPTYSSEHDENTAAEVVEEAPTQKQATKLEAPVKHTPDYYYDMLEEEDEEHNGTITKPTTTMIPEYVRKAKAERFNSKHRQQAEQDNSDYLEDEEALIEHQTQAANESSEELYKHSMQLDEQLLPQAQIQQLPAPSKPRPFKVSSDEDYYDEQNDSSSSSTAAVKTATTTTTTTTTSSTTTTTEAPVPAELPIKPVIQARFGFTRPSSTAAAPTYTAATPTTMAPVVTTTPRKQPKHIHAPPKPELLPADQLRNYIKDVYIRMPLAIIVDPSRDSLDKAKRLYIDALKDKDINIKIVLVTLNAAGAPSTFSFNNTREFIAGLNSTKEHEGGDAFVGVLHAAEMVPYDSAVFISTAKIAPHTELVQDAAITLLKKRIRLFLLWYGERAASENETEEAVGGILGEVAIRSGGEIIHIVSTEHGQHIAGNTLTLVADSYEGAQELEVPVDTTMASLHVKIDASMRRAALETPNGEINLKKLVKFKPRIQTIYDNLPTATESEELDAYVPLNKLRKATSFILKLTPEQLNKSYNVFIRAERKADVFLGDIIKRIDSYYSNAREKTAEISHEESAPSALATLRKAMSTHAKLRFPETKQQLHEGIDVEESSSTSSPKSEVETFSDTEVHSSATPSHNHTAAAVVNYGGQQGGGLNNMLLQRCGTKIELSTQSQLLVPAGQVSHLIYEITNMRAERIYQNVQVTDERRFLVQLTPSSFYLGPRETATVRLTVLVPSGTSPSTTDRITFTSHGTETATLAANLKVLSTIEAQDTTGPSMNWEFGNRCGFVATEALNCAERFWTLDITAQDWQSGILRMQATPSEGLFYRNYYTAGTTEPLKATYMATCCEPKVTIAVHDAAGNQRTINIDVRDIWLTEAAIAAIVLGAILLLLLIVILIVWIVWCCRRRKATLELPTYRSHSTRSME